MSGAYDSVTHIGFDVRGGLLVRRMHHWAAPLSVAAGGKTSITGRGFARRPGGYP